MKGSTFAQVEGPVGDNPASIKKQKGYNWLDGKIT